MKVKIVRTVIVEGKVRRPGDIVDVDGLTKNLLVGQGDIEVIGEKPELAKEETATAKPGEAAVGPKAEGKKKG